MAVASPTIPPPTIAMSYSALILKDLLQGLSDKTLSGESGPSRKSIPEERKDPNVVE
jgi:hypothetical protein